MVELVFALGKYKRILANISKYKQMLMANLRKKGENRTETGEIGRKKRGGGIEGEQKTVITNNLRIRANKRPTEANANGCAIILHCYFPL